MPGRPLLNELEARITAAGGDAVVFEAMEGGVPIRTIAKDFEVSRPMMYKWRNQSQERKDRWEEALKLGADALVDDALELLDSLPASAPPAQVAAAKARADLRVRIAGWRSERYRDHQQAAVTLNINSLHLDALRQFGGPPPTQALPAEIVTD